MASGLNAESGPGEAVERLVEWGDLDELTRLVDRLCLDEAWDALLELRERCRAALQRGKQLWPVAAHAEYRLALEGPGRFAAAMLEPEAGRFTLGPLTEVAASTHTWAELAPHVQPGPMAAMAANERVVRGEDLTDDGDVDPRVLELPLVLQPWEPAYPLATYHPHEAEFPSPPVPDMTAVTMPSSAVDVPEPEPERALLDLAGAWTAESNGRAQVIAVAGDAVAAVTALGPRRARMSEVPASTALAHMAWTGASGGAHGRRRGMATGRMAAWWVVSALSGLEEPAVGMFSAQELGDAAESLRWFLWDAGEPATGWSLHLAVEDPDTGRAWAVAATDAAT